MAECTIVTCAEEAEYAAVLVTTNAHNPDSEHQLPVVYCSEHLASQQKICNGYDSIDLIDIRPIEKGTTVTEQDWKKNYEEQVAHTEEIVAERDGVIARQQEKIRSLEADVNRQAQVLSARNDMIDEQGHTISRQKATNNQQQDEINEKAHQIADLERANHQYESAEVYLKNQNDSLTSVRDALVRFLHAIANEAEQAEEPNVLAENIDDRLEELSLPSRKKHFEMVFTVPVQLRVEGDYPSKEAMREAFERGAIGWNVTDYEDTLEDDLKIVIIEEIPQ